MIQRAILFEEVSELSQLVQESQFLLQLWKRNMEKAKRERGGEVCCGAYSLRA
jgi:hypothetical protein